MYGTGRALLGGLLAVSLTQLGGQVQAGGLSQVIDLASQPPRIGDWTGLYGGATFGLPKVDAIILDDIADGIAAGVHGGYQLDLGELVLGAEVDVNLTAIESFSGDFPLTTLGSVKLRAGYDFDAFLPYITAGVSRAKLAGDVDAHDSGSFVGVGIDHKLTDRVSLGGIYSHYRYDDFAGTGSDFDVSIASARISYHF